MGYEMPKVEVGQTVNWRHSPNAGEKPAPAVVTAVYQTMIDCNVIAKDRTFFLTKSGVRYINDPELATLSPDAAGEGCFELTERDRMIDGLLREFYRKG